MFVALTLPIVSRSGSVRATLNAVDAGCVAQKLMSSRERERIPKMGACQASTDAYRNPNPVICCTDIR